MFIEQLICARYVLSAYFVLISTAALQFPVHPSTLQLCLNFPSKKTAESQRD